MVYIDAVRLSQLYNTAVPHTNTRPPTGPELLTYISNSPSSTTKRRPTRRSPRNQIARHRQQEATPAGAQLQELLRRPRQDGGGVLNGLYLWEMLGVTAGKGEDEYIRAEGQATVARSTRESKTSPPHGPRHDLFCPYTTGEACYLMTGDSSVVLFDWLQPPSETFGHVVGEILPP
ncbi:hypothetical protein K458DRAFT_409779 [Lentithecium fluviatile CBS 122367]|uniref:Uncharacterized protein n=1 Tax=Lentithecium fluviatile CBS 122367 TaxID=1168545 RepID=A0A6G1IGN0_9PLEO|nr:hypothetical protein K458DRAFT_409779 [Lentithecium fluviatile CBS 122367]